MRQMRVPPGEVVAVQGLGGLGHLAIQYANKMGYKVVALSSSGAKEQFAKDLGAHIYVDAKKENHVEALNKLGGAAMIVSTAPNPEVMGEMVNGLGIQGKIIMLARKFKLPSCDLLRNLIADRYKATGEVKINTVPMITKGTSVHGWPSGHALDCEEAVDFAQLHSIKCLVEKFPLAKANEAYEHMMGGKARFRAVLTMT